MNTKYIYASLTRISDLEEKEFQVEKLQKQQWQTGDYVVCKILETCNNDLKIDK